MMRRWLLTLFAALSLVLALLCRAIASGVERSYQAADNLRKAIADEYHVKAILLAVPPALWLIFFIVSVVRGLRAQNRRGAGLCEQCGYDLRATPGRCPECGAVSSRNRAR